MAVRDHNEAFGSGFQHGVQFRTFYEFSIPAGSSIYLKHYCPVAFYVYYLDWEEILP